MQFLSGLLGVLNQLANVLDIPSRFLGILGMLSTVGGYLTGRRSARAQSPEAIVAALLAQLGHTTPASAANTVAGPAAQAAQPLRPGTLPPAPAPTPSVLPQVGPAPLAAAAAAPIIGAASAAVPIAGAASVAGALTQQPSARRKSLWQRASYPWLAIVSTVGLVFSAIAWVFEVAVSTSDSDTALTMLGLFGLLTWAIGLATMIWGAVHAVRHRRWGWLTSIILLGLTGFGFLVPSLITLLFAVIGPKTRPTPKGAPLPLAAYGYPQFYSQQPPLARPLPQQRPPQASGPLQPMPYQVGPQQLPIYPGMAQPPATYTTIPPQAIPAQPVPAQPQPQQPPHSAGPPIRQAGPIGGPQQPAQQHGGMGPAGGPPSNAPQQP